MRTFRAHSSAVVVTNRGISHGVVSLNDNTWPEVIIDRLLIFVVMVPNAFSPSFENTNKISSRCILRQKVVRKGAEVCHEDHKKASAFLCEAAHNRCRLFLFSGSVAAFWKFSGIEW